MGIMSTRPSSGVLHVAIAAVLLAGAFGGAGASVAYRAEAESFAAFQDLGGGEIRVSDCFGASEYKIVDGVDLAGEWIEVPVSLQRSGCYLPVIAYQAGAEWKIGLRVTVLDAHGPGTNYVAEFSLIGTGTG